MKILFIAHDSLKAGSGRCLYELLKTLRDSSDLEPVVLTHQKNNLSEALQSLGIETYSFRYGFTVSWTQSKFWTLVKKLFYRPIFNWLAYYRLSRKLDLKTIDLIHSNSGVIDFGAFLARKRKIKHVWHLREFGRLDFNFNYLVKNFPNYVEVNSDQVLCVSRAIEKYYREQGISKTLTIYDGVVGTDFSGEKLKRSDDLVRICMCGMLADTKGQLLAVEALLQISAQIRERIRLDFWGVGPALKSLQQFVRENNLEKIVAFKGFSQNLHKELLQYDIGLNLSKAEGFGRTTVEYMLSGLYVVGNSTGATPEVLGEGKFGTLIPNGDTKALVRAIEQFAENPCRFKKIAEDGQRFARENFTIENNANKFMLLYRKILA